MQRRQGPRTERRLAMIATALSLASCGGPLHVELRHRARTIARTETSSELARFGSEAELRAFTDRLGEARRLELEARIAEDRARGGPPPVGSAAPPPEATSASGESITNNQVAGVDEGGIVKVHGEHLVILRRGRLFTVRIGERELRPVSMIDAYPEGAPGGWYDEMLVHEDTIVVVGFNQNLRSTELGIFDIDAEGGLRRRGTHYLRSSDYYSSRNYASRLLGHQLVFYLPCFLMRGMDGHYTLPALREGGGAWQDIIRTREIYRPIQTAVYPMLHTVVTCDLATSELECRAQGIIGPDARSFFVSRDAVYLWVGADEDDRSSTEADAVVYRLPFDGSAVGAVRVAGMPTDQLSFEERDGSLNVLVRAEALGDWMWAPEVSDGDVALVRIPLAMFGDGLTTAQRDQYTRLPRVSGSALQNRFVNRHVLYGIGGGWGDAEHATVGRVIVHDVDGGATNEILLPHVVDRIEVMGSDAVVVGAGGGDLHFSAIALERAPRVAGHYAEPGSSQGETRTHGFFYRPDGDTSGTLGLPIRGGGAAGWHQLVEGSAGVLFLRVQDHQLAPIGVLASSGQQVDDRCQASCVDWYGNARPIFLGGRILALLGYELVEGAIEGSTIREVARTSFFPAPGARR